MEWDILLETFWLLLGKVLGLINVWDLSLLSISCFKNFKRKSRSDYLPSPLRAHSILMSEGSLDSINGVRITTYFFWWRSTVQHIWCVSIICLVKSTEGQSCLNLWWNLNVYQFLYVSSLCFLPYLCLRRSLAIV